MFKKSILLLAAAVMAAGLTACSSVDTATNLNNVSLSANGSDTTLAHLHGKVWGVYLFNLLPVVTGSTSHVGSCEVFKDTVRIENAVRMITKKASTLDATRLTDLSSETTTVPLVISVKVIQVSGNAIK